MGSMHEIQQVVPLIFVMVILSLSIPEIAGQTISFDGIAPGGSFLQTDSVLESIRQSDGTVRADPLHNLRKYRGGYNVANKHYWSSTIFTGIYGYCLGVLWLLCGIGYGGFLLVTTFRSKGRKSGKLKKISPTYKQCRLWPLLLVTFFTVLAIVASGLVLGGNARFYSQARTVVSIITNTANEASETIYNTTGALEDITSYLGEVDGTSSASGFLNSTSEKLNVQAADIQRQAKKNRHLIDKGLRKVYIITTLVISLNLVAVIALSVSGILNFHWALHMFITLCWLLTVLCFFFFGMYFFLEKFSSDTCTALENFQQNPNNSSLSSILPCDELSSAKSVLFDLSAGIYNLVKQVNGNISLKAASSPNLVFVCNPFSAPPEYQYQPDNCPADTIRIGDIPKALKLLTCSDTNNGTCQSGQFISYSTYNTAKAFSSSIQTLLNAYPGMESLIECKSVKDGFSEILLKHCRPLKRYVRMVWVSMFCLSMIMVLLVLIWISKAQQDQNRDFSDGSVKHHSATEDIPEAGAAKEADTHTQSNIV